MVMPDVQPWMMMVKRDPAPQLVKGALMQFYRRKKRTDMLRTMHVCFVGENGVDAGGLRKDMFQTLFERVTDSSHPLCLFEWRKGGRGCLPKRICGADASMVGLEETHMTQSERLKLFEGLGRALLKALMDQITIPCSAFAPSLFRFLLGRAGPGGMPLIDLEEFDPVLARQLNDHILGKHIGSGSALGLDFAGLRGSLNESSWGGQATAGQSVNRVRLNSHEELSESNKREYVRLIRQGARAGPVYIDAMRRGFTSVDIGEILV